MHAVGIPNLSAWTCCYIITSDKISKATFLPVRYILCVYMSALAPPSMNLATASDLICLQHPCVWRSGENRFSKRWVKGIFSFGKKKRELLELTPLGINTRLVCECLNRWLDCECCLSTSWMLQLLQALELAVESSHFPCVSEWESAGTNRQADFNIIVPLSSLLSDALL